MQLTKVNVKNVMTRPAIAGQNNDDLNMTNDKPSCDMLMFVF